MSKITEEQAVNAVETILDYLKQEMRTGLEYYAQRKAAGPVATPPAASNVVPIRRSAGGETLEQKLEQSVAQGAKRERKAKPEGAGRADLRNFGKLDGQIVEAVGKEKYGLKDVLTELEMKTGNEPDRRLVQKRLKSLVDEKKLATEGEKRGMKYFNPETFSGVEPEPEAESAAEPVEPAAEPEPAKAAEPEKPLIRRRAGKNGDGKLSAWCRQKILENLAAVDMSLDELTIHLGNDARSANQEVPLKSAVKEALDALLGSGEVVRGVDNKGVEFFQPKEVSENAQDTEPDPATLPPG